MYRLTGLEEELCSKIVDSAYRVHRQLGPGLLEKIYETCFCYELSKKGLNYRRQVSLPVRYDGIVFDEGLRVDVLIENRIVCELKAADQVHPVWQAQVLSHLKLTGNNIGFLINFNAGLIRNGIRRFCIE